MAYNLQFPRTWVIVFEIATGILKSVESICLWKSLNSPVDKIVMMVLSFTVSWTQSKLLRMADKKIAENTHVENVCLRFAAYIVHSQVASRFPATNSYPFVAKYYFPGNALVRHPSAYNL